MHLTCPGRGERRSGGVLMCWSTLWFLCQLTARLKPRVWESKREKKILDGFTGLSSGAFSPSFLPSFQIIFLKRRRVCLMISRRQTNRPPPSLLLSHLIFSFVRSSYFLIVHLIVASLFSLCWCFRLSSSLFTRFYVSTCNYFRPDLSLLHMQTEGDSCPTLTPNPTFFPSWWRYTVLQCTITGINININNR